MSKLSEMSTQRVGIVESGYDHLQLALAMIWLKIWRLTATIDECIEFALKNIGL
jgi:hypothetical protein